MRLYSPLLPKYRTRSRSPVYTRFHPPALGATPTSRPHDHPTSFYCFGPTCLQHHMLSPLFDFNQWTGAIFDTPRQADSLIRFGEIEGEKIGFTPEAELPCSCVVRGVRLGCCVHESLMSNILISRVFGLDAFNVVVRPTSVHVYPPGRAWRLSTSSMKPWINLQQGQQGPQAEYARSAVSPVGVIQMSTFEALVTWARTGPAREAGNVAYDVGEFAKVRSARYALISVTLCEYKLIRVFRLNLRCTRERAAGLDKRRDVERATATRWATQCIDSEMLLRYFGEEV
jgi:hypothetical protein